jgi:CPA2 family monovalent cation:H+ antiporter-2
MLFDPHFLLETPGLIAATCAIILLAKPLSALIIVLILGYPPKVALCVSVALAQIGEFSFILATLGKTLGVLPDADYNALVAAAMVSISLNPLIYRMIDPAHAWAARHPWLWRRLTAAVPATSAQGSIATSDHDPALSSRHRAIVVGYGPVGRTLTQLLRDNDIEPTIIDMNLQTVHSLRSSGLQAVYGDATRTETLKRAEVDRAGSIILSSSGMRAAEEVIRLARELNPKIRVLARTASLHERASLRKAGADLAFSGEGEVALAMTESVMRALGATNDQIERERDRVRADLFGEAVPGELEAVPGELMEPQLEPGENT